MTRVNVVTAQLHVAERSFCVWYNLGLDSGGVIPNTFKNYTRSCVTPFLEVGAHHMGRAKRKKSAWSLRSCACAKCHPGLCSPFIHSVVSNDSVSGQRTSFSDRAGTQADQGLRCPYMPEDTFSHGAAHIQLNVNGSNLFGVMEICSRHW